MKKDNRPQGEELFDEQIQAEENTAEIETDREESPDAAADTVEEFEASGAEETGDGEDADSSDPAEAEEEDGENGEEEAPGKKVRAHRDTRRLRYGGMATALTAAVVAAVVLINVVVGILNDRFPINFDLTKDKLYTLSDDSRKVAKGVKKDTEIIVFAEESLFSNPNQGDENINTIFKQFSEVVKQYNSLSGGKIKTKYVDLVGDPTQATKYSKYEISNGDILFISGARWQKSSVNSLYTYDQEQSYYQMVGVASEVEPVLASNIAMITSEFTPVVTILTGHEEDSATISGIESVIKNNNYKTETLDITASGKFNGASTLALIAAPRTDYTDAEIEKLRTWLANGGKYNRNLFVVANYETNCPNLYEFLDVEYGLLVTDQLISETDYNRLGTYNYFATLADVGTSDFTGSIQGKRVYMPYTRQIITKKENDTNNSLYNVNIATFPDSARITQMAEALSESNSDKELKQTKADKYPLVGMAYATKWGYNSDNEQYKTNVLVSGSYSAFNQGVLTSTAVQNEKLLLSLLNGFTGNKNDVMISGKPLEKTNLEFTAGQANIFFAIFVFAVPVAILVIGIVIFVRRRRL